MMLRINIGILGEVSRTTTKSSSLKVYFLIFILFTLIFTGCIQDEQQLHQEQGELDEIIRDAPSILPDWTDGDYHDYYGTTKFLHDFDDKYPELITIFTIGESVLGRDIWCIRITNENKKSEAKLSCFIDGCIHGVEWEAGEACLYLAEYLLINFNNNETITTILNTTEVYLVPLVNPDGRQNNDLWLGNDNGVDLNRNFDVFFGRLRGHCLRLGKLFGRIKIPVIKIRPNDPSTWWRNCGRYAFSEPESQALRDFMNSLHDHGFSFYVNCHTATHEIMAPWATLKPPFEMTQRERNVFDYVLDWVEANTEYGAYRTEGDNVGGVVMDWCFKEFRIPSFTFEILSLDYDSFYGDTKHDHLVHWMKTTLPVFMYLLVNIDNLYNWETPDIHPLLPKGVPPDPL